MKFAPFGPALLILVASTAQASTPVPDRPTHSRSGKLIATNTLEGELGATFDEEGVVVPLRVKWSNGRLEPRVTVDLASMGSGAPVMDVGGKIGIVQDRKVQFAAQALSAIPMGGEIWTGEVGALFTFYNKNGLEVRTDLALALVGGGSLNTAGMPFSGLAGWALNKRWSAFVDGSTTLYAGGVGDAPLVVGGARWRPTTNLTADMALGWDFETGGPSASLGVSGNFGQLIR